MFDWCLASMKDLLSSSPCKTGACLLIGGHHLQNISSSQFYQCSLRLWYYITITWSGKIIVFKSSCLLYARETMASKPEQMFNDPS